MPINISQNKKSLWSILTITLLAAFITIAAPIIDFNLEADANASLDDLGYKGYWYTIETADVYVDAPENRWVSYSDYASQIIQNEMTALEAIDYIIEVDTSLSCSAHVCTKVTYQDKYEHAVVSYIDWHVQVEYVAPPEYEYEEAIALPIKGYTHYGNGPTESQVETFKEERTNLSTANTNLRIANDALEDKVHELNTAKNNHSSKVNDLVKAENTHRNYAAAANDFGRQAQQASQRATLAKQQLSNETEILNRLKSERSSLRTEKAQATATLNSLNASVSSNASSIHTEHNNTLSNQNSIVAASTAQIQTKIRNGFDSHNLNVTDIVLESGIRQTIDDINIDYFELINSEVPGYDLDEPVNEDYEIPETSPVYAEYVEAVRYRDFVRSELSGVATEEQNDLLEFADYGIEMAKDLINSAEDVSATVVLEHSLDLLDAAIDFVPGLAFTKDVFSIVTGFNPINGEELDSIDRSMLMATLFLPAAASGTLKVATKAAKHFEDLAAGGGEWASKARAILDTVDETEIKISDLKIECDNPLKGCKIDELNTRLPNTLKKDLDKDSIRGKSLLKTSPGEYYDGVEKVFTPTQYRKNMKDLNKTPNLDKSIEAHHIFPKDLQPEFMKIGIWVHDPRLMLPIPKAIHSKLHNGPHYNNFWEVWLSKNENATPQEALKIAKEYIMKSEAAEYFLGYF